MRLNNLVQRFTRKTKCPHCNRRLAFFPAPTECAHCGRQIYSSTDRRRRY